MPTQPTAPPTMPAPFEGPRGEGWVVLQGALLVLYLLLPRLGPPWPASLRSVARVAGGASLLGGGALLATGALALGPNVTPLPHPKTGGRLVEHGPYRLVRHPIYSGLCLGALGGALLTAHTARLALAFLLLLFFDAKTRREETWLLAAYPDYADYRRRVRRLIPWLY